MFLLLKLLLFSILSSASIPFPFVQPKCDVSAEQQTCLRGQICTGNDTCMPVASIHRRVNDDTITPPRTDGQCGLHFNDATCNANGPFGGCCSIHGWCGNTPEYCLPSNCYSGCSSSAGGQQPAQVTTQPAIAKGEAPAPASTPSNSNNEPVISAVSSASGASPTGPVTTDGSCGAENGGTVCGNWPKGSCCSMYGYCGDTTAHCGDGCQSGPCVSAPVAPPPSASPAPPNATPGSLNVVGRSGVPVMHAALMPNGNVVFLDKVENYTEAPLLSDGQYAYSAEYDPISNKVVASLRYDTNAFCSGGSFVANGTLINVGGNGPLDLDPTVGDGFRAIRYLTHSPSEYIQDWQEPGNKLDTARWYASVQSMPDSTLFVASGSLNGLLPTDPINNNPTYEILSAEGITNGRSIDMALLQKAQPYFMYPFIHLLPDGTLFVFVGKHSEIFDVGNGATVKTFPDLAGDFRTYPNTGGSVLLPLHSENSWGPEVVICGGGPYQDITAPADPSCGRIRPLDNDAAWELDSMPEGRGMVEGILLPDGTVLFLNGCQLGAQGYGGNPVDNTQFQLATDPAYEALIYDPNQPLHKRWSTAGQSKIARLYHSVALLLLDGTVMVAGSNPNQLPSEQINAKNPYPTEWQVETYTPPYLSGDNANRRPSEIKLSTTLLQADSSTFTISFTAPQDAQIFQVALYHGGFVTHSLHMSHRMLFLDTRGWEAGATQQQMQVTMPPNSSLAPPGPYVVYVTADGVPGIGQFVMVS